MELQLRQVRKELSSVQLIVDKLNKERTQVKTDIASLDGTQTDQERHGTWEEMTRKSSKKRYEGNIYLKNKGSLNSNDWLVVTSNWYAAFGTGNLTPRNEDETHTIYSKRILSRKETQDEETQQ